MGVGVMMSVGSLVWRGALFVHCCHQKSLHLEHFCDDEPVEWRSGIAVGPGAHGA
jgi:hypothetical protein